MIRVRQKYIFTKGNKREERILDLRIPLDHGAYLVWKVYGWKARIERENKGQANIFSIVGLVYLGFMLVVLLTIF